MFLIPKFTFFLLHKLGGESQLLTKEKTCQIRRGTNTDCLLRATIT